MKLLFFSSPRMRLPNTFITEPIFVSRVIIDPDAPVRWEPKKDFTSIYSNFSYLEASGRIHFISLTMLPIDTNCTTNMYVSILIILFIFFVRLVLGCHFCQRGPLRPTGGIWGDVPGTGQQSSPLFVDTVCQNRPRTHQRPHRVQPWTFLSGLQFPCQISPAVFPRCAQPRAALRGFQEWREGGKYRRVRSHTFASAQAMCRVAETEKTDPLSPSVSFAATSHTIGYQQALDQHWESAFTKTVTPVPTGLPFPVLILPWRQPTIWHGSDVWSRAWIHSPKRQVWNQKQC